MYDLLITNGLIVDGTGKAPYGGDIAITADKIAAIGQNLGGSTSIAKKVFDAQGCVVSPGFIDIHSHSDWCPFYKGYQMESKLQQGITLEIVGNCGISLLPTTTAKRAEITELMASGLELPMHGLSMVDETVTDYEKHLQQMPPCTDMGLLIGHGTLRAVVMGFAMKEPSAAELAGMESLLDKLMSEGAFGMSLGLIYPPSAYGQLEELVALAKVVKRHNGILAVHMRSESTKIFEAVDEMLTVAKRSGVHLQISHLKLIGRPQWGRAQELLAKIKAARAAGVEVTCDQYPYLATCASLAVLIPDRMKDGGTEAMCERLKHPDAGVIAETKAEMERRGGAEGVLVITTTGWKPAYDGKTLGQIAADMHMLPEVAASEILVQSKGLAPCCYFCLNEEDMLTIMQEKFIAVGCDGYALPYDRDFFMGSNPHPRSYGSFPKFFQTVREKKVLSLEEAVYKTTGLAAQILHLPERGQLSVGKRADITVFDWEKIKDLTEYTNPFQKPEGIKMVVLNGKIALENKELVGKPQGHLVKHC